MLALVQAPRLVGPDRGLQSGFANHFLEQLVQLAFTVGRAAAARGRFVPLVGTYKYVPLKLGH
jgi:hypothetical protein